MVNSATKFKSQDQIKIEMDSVSQKENYSINESQIAFVANKVSKSTENFAISEDLKGDDIYSSKEINDDIIQGDSCSTRRRISRLNKRLNSNKTYGLRPREDLRKPSYDFDFDEKEPPEEVVTINRRARKQGRNHLQSKYRRKTANARERHRMKEINDAFTTLRGILPPMSTRRTAQVSMTKIRILRLAASYIEALSELLTDPDAGIKTNSNMRNTLNSYSEQLFSGLHSEDRFTPKKERLDEKIDNKFEIHKNNSTKERNSESNEFNDCEGDLIAFLEEASSINESFTTSLEELYFSLS